MPTMPPSRRTEDAAAGAWASINRAAIASNGR
jgi:hypothetical protein